MPNLCCLKVTILETMERDHISQSEANCLEEEEEEEEEEKEEEIGTGITGMERKGSLLRIKDCAEELFSMEDYLIYDDHDSWEFIGRDLRLKSMFLFFELNRVISNILDEQKKILTDLSNRLFQCMEELVRAVDSRSISTTLLLYGEAAVALQEVVATLFSIFPPHKIQICREGLSLSA